MTLTDNKASIVPFSDLKTFLRVFEPAVPFPVSIQKNALLWKTPPCFVLSCKFLTCQDSHMYDDYTEKERRSSYRTWSCFLTATHKSYLWLPVAREYWGWLFCSIAQDGYCPGKACNRLRSGSCISLSCFGGCEITCDCLHRLCLSALCGHLPDSDLLIMQRFLLVCQNRSRLNSLNLIHNS